MKIFLAGGEGSDPQELLSKIDNIFLSYYYLRNSKKSEEILKNTRKNCKTIIIDSGAHTFFSERASEGLSVSVHKKTTKTKEDPDQYFKKYLQWIKENEKFFDFFVELDIGEIVGQKKVEKWRNEIGKAKLLKKCITVFHPAVMSFEDYKKLVDSSESKYVAVEGDRPQLRKRIDYLPLLKYAYDRKVRVHGFAMTKRDVMEKYPFYSVDSTSWIAGTQYGSQLFKIKEKVINIRFSYSGIRTKEIKKVLENKNNLKNQRKVLLEESIKAYKQLEKFYSDLWAKKGIKQE